MMPVRVFSASRSTDRPLPNASTRHTDEPLRIGDKILGRYIIAERIASGGYSVVYRADDERLNRSVCAKVFHRLSAKDGAYQSAYEHFVQEAFALSKLTHPNTLRIYDFGYLPRRDTDTDTDDSVKGPPFQISEYMDRGTLWKWVRKLGPVREPRDRIRIVNGLGGALAEAHGYGIIHRDIKPQNILFNTVGRDWVTKLADFGIAKSLPTANEWLSQQVDDTAIVAGRPLVMYSERWASPEQMIGEQVMCASDIYALALSIIYMLTGNIVFTRRDRLNPYEDRKYSERHIDSAFSGIDVPSQAIELLQRACAFNVEERPDDAQSFTSDMCDALTIRHRHRTPQLRAVPRPATEPSPAPAMHTPARRLRASANPFTIADRYAMFVPAPIGSIDISCCNGAQRLRVTFVPSPGGFCVHVKGLTCFLSLVDGRPTGAVNFESDGRCTLMSSAQKPIASMAVMLGSPAAGHRIFTVGTEAIALSVEECPFVAVLDFGSGSECLIVYRPSPNTAQASAPDRRGKAR